MKDLEEANMILDIKITRDSNKIRWLNLKNMLDNEYIFLYYISRNIIR